jgi:hypothetical protein
MDITQILGMLSGGKKNPALEQLMAVSSMLNKLPQEEQQRVITNFVEDLKSSVAKLEDK